MCMNGWMDRLEDEMTDAVLDGWTMNKGALG